jgi:outer membrane protein insertion porin family
MPEGRRRGAGSPAPGRCWAAAALAAAGLLLPPPARAQEGPIVEELAVDGNQTLSSEAFFRLISLKVGDPYDEDAIRKEFRRLWDRGLFDDLRVEARDGRAGKIVIFHVKERRRLNSIDYEKNKAVSETQIEEQLTQRDISLRIGSPVDYRAIQDTVEVIRGVLGAKGFLDPKVDYVLHEVDPGTLALTFQIRPGRKTRLKELNFSGNTVYSDRKLRSTLKLTKEYKWWKLWGRSKTLYHPQKLDEDLRSVEDLYANNGYIDARVKAPLVAVKEGKPTKNPDKRKRWVAVDVPLTEGPQYRVGELRIEGNTIFTDDEILAWIPLKEGQVFNSGALKAGTSRVELAYGERGHFFVSTNRLIERKEGNVADATIRIDEDKKYFVDRIEFVGNTNTRDYVLRREMGVQEEELFDLKKFRLGLRKIAQLGYFQLTREPQITPVPGENRVQITIEGVEQGHRELQVGGGFGPDGASFYGVLSDRNFLGRGLTLSTRLQIGAANDTFSVAFTDPWFLGKPWIFGASLFQTTSDFIGFERDGRGYGLSIGKRVGDFSSFSIAYLWEEVTFDQSPPFEDQTTRTSSIRPVYTYDTRNNFFRPTRGFRFVGSVEVAGGPLGGDNFFWKPILEATKYIPTGRGRTYFGVRGEIGYVDDFDGRAVPIFERFFLGGERTLRVFPTRSVSPIDDGNPPFPRERGRRRVREYINPLDPLGNIIDPNDPLTFVGGNKYLLFNLEYVIPGPGESPIELALFFDAGNAWKNNETYDLADLRKDAGIELRFYLPVFGAPIRLIYGWILDPKPYEQESDFIFSIGTTF